MKDMGDVGLYISQHCYLCERPITASDVLVRNGGGLQVVVQHRYGLRLRAHRRCWQDRYGEDVPKEEQAAMELNNE